MASKKNKNSKNSSSGKDSASKKARSSRSKTTEIEPVSAVVSDKKIKKNPAGSKMRDNITAVILIALSVFLIIALMTEKAGKAGIVISMVLKGCLGVMAVVLPFFLLAYSVCLLLGLIAHINSRTVFFSIIMFVDITVMLSARFPDVKSNVYGLQYIMDMFVKGMTYESAGSVGMAFGWLLVKFTGLTGLIIIGIVILIISLMLIANTPISSFFDRRREKKNRRNAGISDDYDEEDPDMAEEAPERENRRRSGAKKKTKADNKKMFDKIFGTQEETIVFSDYEKDMLDAAVEDRGYEELDADRVRSAAYDSISDAKNRMSDNQRRLNELTAPVENGAREGAEAQDPDNPSVHEMMNDDTLFSGRNINAEILKNAAETMFVKSAVPKVIFEDNGVDPNDDAADARTDTEAEINSEKNNRRPYSGAAAAAGTVKKRAETVNDADRPEGISVTGTSGKEYQLPPLSLLNKSRGRTAENRRQLKKSEEALERVLKSYGVDATVEKSTRGPSVTRFEVKPAVGVKVSRIVNLADDIALNMRAKSLRIEAPIPGKAAVGIEIENEKTDMVCLREMIDSAEFHSAKSKISFAVGEDIAGNPVIADLRSMPHLLIAGSTGSGKSVCINSILISMLYRSTPDEVKFILIDPKVVELSNYNGIPHMLIPVVTSPARAASALAWAVKEMDERYQKFSNEMVKDFRSFNEKLRSEGRIEETIPQIVIVIDELADLMMAAGKQVEESICRLAQLARAAGMHMIVATQRPSVDVVTGLIKANIPSRIAFAVSSQVDSRTIIDRAGAEKLIGNGDMLFAPLGKAQPQRLQGPFVNDDEIEAVLDFWKKQIDGRPVEPEQIMRQLDSAVPSYSDDPDTDELLEEAIDLVFDTGQASASMLQRRFRIGYNRAGRMMDIMEDRGIIGPSMGSKPRKLLVTREEYENMTSGTRACAAGGNNDTAYGNSCGTAEGTASVPEDAYY